MGQNDIRLMEAAIALVEELNFSRAAQKLHITQPALTKRISELEDRLGIPLFPRDHQVVEVNDSARALSKRHEYPYFMPSGHFRLLEEQRGAWISC
jgi:DNA-binding transcriptional LysR family regulator